MCVYVCVDNLVSKVSRGVSGNVTSGQKEVEASPVGLSPVVTESPPPPPPSFARAPAEDRSKYEKLFCYGYSDAEDELEVREGNAAGAGLRLNGRNSNGRESEEGVINKVERLNKNSARLKLTDEDSIGSATDLKNCSDEEMDEPSKRKYAQFLLFEFKQGFHFSICVFRSRQNVDEESETVSSSVYHGECDSIRTEPIEPPTSINRSKFVNKKTEQISSTEDALVGHAFGERPLLADDELDDDSLHSTLPRAPIKTSRLPNVPLPFRYLRNLKSYSIKNSQINHCFQP